MVERVKVTHSSFFVRYIKVLHIKISPLAVYIMLMQACYSISDEQSFNIALLPLFAALIGCFDKGSRYCVVAQTLCAVAGT